MTKLWPVIAALALAPICQAQVVLSARDSTVLVNAVLADLRENYGTFAGTGFVFDTTGASLGPLAVRLLAAMRSGDTTAGSPPSRTTPRARFSNFSFAGDTATLSVSVSRCTFEPREWIWSTSSTHRYIRIGDRWERERNRPTVAGDGTRCPY